MGRLLSATSRLLVAFIPVAVWAAAPTAKAHGEEILLEGHEGAVTMARFVTDASYAVTGCTDGVARLFETSSGTEIRRYAQHTAPILCLDVGTDGRLLATGAQDNTVRLWDLPSATPALRLAAGDKPVCAIRTMASGDAFFAVDKPGFAIIASSNIDASTSGATPAAESVAVPGAAIRCLSIRGDETLIATGDEQGQVSVWSPFLRKPILQIDAHEDRVQSVWFSGNSTTIVSVDVSGNIRVWQIADALAGKQVKADDGSESTAVPIMQREFRLADAKPKQTIAASGGAQLISVLENGTVLVGDINSGKVIRELTKVEAAVQCVAARPDNQRIAGGTASGLVIWSSAGEVMNSELAQGIAISTVAWSHDGKSLATVDNENVIRVFGPSLPGQPQQELVLQQTVRPEGSACALAFSPDNRDLWVGHSSGHVSKWRMAAPAAVRQLTHSGAVYGVTFTADSKVIVTCGADQTVRVWETETGRQKFQMRGHQGAVHAVAVNSEGTLAITSGADGTLRLWDIVGGRQLKELARFEETIYSLGMHRDGVHAFTGGADRQIRVIELASGITKKTLQGHRDYIHSVRSNADGSRLYSYGYSGALKIWDYATGTLLGSLQAGRIGNFADVSLDQKRILVASGDGTATILSPPAAASSSGK